MSEKAFSQLALAPAVGSIEAYTYQINRLPLLSAEEEDRLARRLREHGDLEAARQLVMAHLRFVVKIARGYAGYGLAQSDLIQEGNLGLMKAVKRFNPDVGVRLVSFAVHWIKAEIHEFILKNWRIVKVATTKAQRKLFFNLRRMSKRVGGCLTQAEVEDIAATLNVKPQEVRVMEERLNGNDTAFDAPAEEDGAPRFSPVTYLADDSHNPSALLEADSNAQDTGTKLSGALAHLDARSREIIETRWLTEKKATLHDLAAKYRISAERVRQIERQAMGKIKDHMESTGGGLPA